jgi:iron complex transport system substrate-binding protein
MAGRRTRIPADIQKVYSTGQPGCVMMYTLCPDKLLGWCIAPSEAEKAYLSPKYLSLPVLGLMQGSNNTASKEEIIGREPNIILLATLIDEETAVLADEIQTVMNIPVVVLDYSLRSLKESYGFLGDILNERERAEVLGIYCAETVGMAETAAAAIPESERLSVYYAQGSKGLQTAPKGSSHSEVIDLVGGGNVVSLDAGADGRLSVNMEQLLLWDPDVIITSYSMNHEGMKVNGPSAADLIRDAGDAWRLIKAVREEAVFAVPCLPYNWLDMPPSANRIIGIKWLGNLLYPQYFQYDIREEAREFYRIFYNKNLTEDQMNMLLDQAAR